MNFAAQNNETSVSTDSTYCIASNMQEQACQQDA